MNEPIAIVGLGCRLPGANNPQTYWRLMCDGVDVITTVPPERWDVDAFHDPRPATPGKMVSRWGGFLEGLDQFDPYFFGISPREAVHIDPQQRLLLEAAWHAMEDAGTLPEELRGSRTGVYVGISNQDYAAIQLADIRNLNAYFGTGAGAASAGRLANILGLNGPNLSVDTGCSASMVAVHLAVESLARHECDSAFAGGVNVILLPQNGVALSQAGVLSPDGRCKTFDERANGFVRSEGAGVVLLKRLSTAVEHRDRIYAVIRGTAMSNDGSWSRFMAPSREGQQEALREAYRKAGIPPSQVQYVEAHGTGTKVGDPIEVDALSRVLGADRRRDLPCRLGSSKTNIGHTEAAAGVAGLIKTALCLWHRQIPPNLHCDTPNPDIAWDEIPFVVQRELTSWPDSDHPATAGVNSFGMSGTNAHAVLTEAPAGSAAESSQTERSGPFLLPLSAQSAEALTAAAGALRDWMNDAGTVTPVLADLCYTASRRRSHYAHRIAVVADSPEELSEQLELVAAGDQSGNGRKWTGRQPVFVFSGVGSQWAEMGRELRAREPVFRDAMEACDAAILRHTGWSVIAVIETPDAVSELNRIDIQQPAIFAVQVSLAALWDSWGIRPAAVAGHSLGEYAAAHVAGAISLEEAALGVCTRSRLMKRVAGLGRMLAVGLGWDEARRLETEFGGRVSAGVWNAASSTVLSGDPNVLALIEDRLKADGVFCRFIAVDVACHSAQLDPLLDELVDTLKGFDPKAVSIPLYSTVTGSRVSGEDLGAEYWKRNLRDPVLFAPAVDELLDAGHDLFLEVSPHPMLLAPIQQAIEKRAADVSVVPSLRRRQADWRRILESLGALYMDGCDVDWARLQPDGARVVSMPGYQWQRERFWIEHPGHLAKTAREPDEPASQDELTDYLYQIHWEAVPQSRDCSEKPGQWLILGDKDGLGQQLREVMEARGASCAVVSGDELELENPAAFARLAKPAESGSWRGIVVLLSLDAAPNAELSSQTLASAQQQVCRSMLYLLQAISDGLTKPPPRLWLVTRGARAIGENPAPLSLSQASLQGLARIIDVEHPDLRVTTADLPVTSESSEADRLAGELLSGEQEREIAWRDGQRYVARFIRVEKEAVKKKPRIEAEATYLITGGLGGIGLACAEWLVERGARSVVVLGRSGPTAEAREKIQSMEQAGARIVVAAADVSLAEELAAVFDQIRETMPPLKGVIHAAGVFRDRMLQQMDWAEFETVLQPKVSGSWNLHEQLQETDLDFFVLFSSMSSVLGGVGQGNYAAANAFLDGLAHYRRALGLPALAINWGPWADVGVAADPALRDVLAAQGMISIRARQGLEILGDLLGHESASIAVVGVDWERRERSFPETRSNPVFSGLTSGETAAGKADGGAAVLSAVMAAEDSESATAVLLSFLQDAVSKVLRVPAPRLDRSVGLTQLGLDSLMAMELRNRLERGLPLAIPVVKLLEGPSLEQLSDWLYQEISKTASEVAELSDEEVEKMLNAAG